MAHVLRFGKMRFECKLRKGRVSCKRIRCKTKRKPQGKIPKGWKCSGGLCIKCS